MFLSGMGSTGKVETNKVLVQFTNRTSIAFGWNYDNDVIKITTLTGSTVCKTPNGRTLHSQWHKLHKYMQWDFLHTDTGSKINIIVYEAT